MSKSDNRRSQESYQQAMDRLEEAVKELGDAAKGNFADRAADVLEQTAAKLKGESSSESSSERSEERSSDGYSLDSGRFGHWRSARSPRPFRDLDNARLAGICAGIAPYLGLEVWVVRCLALTVLIFAGSIIIPAYIVAYFVLEPRSELDELDGRFSSRRKRKRYARNKRAEARAEKRALRKEQRREPRKDYKRTPKEAGAAQPLPARNVLRSVQNTLNDAESRLRRMEGHVTSGRYELQKELRKIERTS